MTTNRTTNRIKNTWVNEAARDYNWINQAASFGSGVRYRKQALLRAGLAEGRRAAGSLGQLHLLRQLHL